MAEVEIRPPRDEAEMRQLWQLNHAVFSEELHQHEIHQDGLLIDKFHAKNLYYAGWDHGEAVGMICAHWKEPFSAVERFGEVIRREMIPGHTAELRLFAIRPEYRKTPLAPRLGAKIVEEGFLASFVGQEEGMAVTKDGGTVDSITAATISSQAMANAANTAIAAVKALG